MSNYTQPFSREGFELMGAAFEVHNVLGGGLSEGVYQQSLEVELELRGIAFRSKQELKVFYKDQQLRQKFVPDLFVFDGIVVELKATNELTPKDESQLINYMRIAHSPIGYLINFGPIGKLQYKRFILSEFLVPE